ncbi:MAG: OB-fold nucleic acid binding domain-containing protein, partial [Terriglobia bacterium]
MTELQRYANRTHFCGELRVKNTDQTVELAGWVHSRRDHGGLLFIDLRDRTGLVQVVFDPNENKEAFEAAEAVRPEFVLRVGGHVRARPEGTVNEAIGTGEIEVAVTSIVVLNSAETPPFEIDDDLRVDDGLRLQYRYLDLRRSPMLGNLRMRHTVARAAREFLDRSGFTEVETPVLTKS